MSVTDISVNGEDGSVVSRRLGVRVVPQNDLLPLIRAGTANRDGQHGTHAASATPGAPAGHLAVDLSESALVREGVHVQVIRFEGRQQPPQQLIVPPRRDLRLSAIGGKGEAGHDGGNGQAGIKGADGSPATREVDATPGTNGGNGGDAGRGSHGADGGLGGTIEVSVDEDNTHLLLVVQYDVNGGDGGEPGKHGAAGLQGAGGVGGAGHKWRELVGYKYICTASCVGPVASTNSTSLMRIGTSKLGGSTTALMSGMRSQIVEGGNLQALIATAATAYGTRRQRAVDPGYCHCKGGQGNCLGCDAKPIYFDCQRVAALNGREGRPGGEITDPLFKGNPGPPGTLEIYVRYHDGSTNRYDRLYQLELIDFDVEDENGDGIFEPGEHILIRRIRVRNTGGMPSPKLPIPISVASSTEFIPVAGNEGTAFIPGLIEPGTAVTLDGTIKLLIPLVEEAQPVGSRLFRTGEVAIQASIPWLHRDLPNFSFSKTVDIQYPVELRNFTYLQTMALGSTGRFSYEVFNKSAKAIDTSPGYDRNIETEISFPSDCGSLKNQEASWVDKVERQLPQVPSNESIICDETLRIGIEAISYRRVKVRISLYLSMPRHDNVPHIEPTVELQAIEHTDLEIQLASHHTFSPASKFLLITNPETTRDRVRILQDFVVSQLGMQMDEWNVGLYGGFGCHPDADSAPDNVLKMYKNKAVILLDNKFDLRNSDPCCVSDLCDPMLFAELGMAGTRFVFLDCSNEWGFEAFAQAAGLPTVLKSETILSHRKNVGAFDSETALLDSILQEMSIEAAENDTRIYTIPIRSAKHNLFRRTKPEKRAEKVKRYLQHNLPQQRFLVTTIATDLDDATQQTYLAISNGMDHSTDITALKPQPHSSRISKFESYAITNSLSVHDGLNSIWASYDTQEGTELCLASLSLLLRLNSEILRFIRNNPWPNKIPIPKLSQRDNESLKRFFRIHLPTLFTLLVNETPEQRAHREQTPDYLKIFLAYAVASSRPQRKRHILGSVALPVSNRRRQLHQCLLIYVEKFVPNIDMKTFHTDVRSLHSLRNKEGKRDTTAALTRMISEATQQSTHRFSQSQTSVCKILPQSKACTTDEWDRRWNQTETMQAKIKADTVAAKATLRAMNLADGTDDGVELPA